MARKRYLVEQVTEDEKEKEPMKEQAEDNESGLLKKDESPQTTAKVAEPVKQSEPSEPLEKAKALTEEAGASPSDEVLNQILTKLNNLEAQVAGMSQVKTEEAPKEEEPAKKEPMTEMEDEDSEKEKPMTEEAVGFEGDSPSGPSLGTKSDTGNGGLSTKDEDPAIQKKTEGEAKEAEPTKSLDTADQLTEAYNRRSIRGGSYTANVSGTSEILNAMKEYANGGISA